jgi:dTDP-4-amino-4,6-dideoxygalactose transaminase
MLNTSFPDWPSFTDEEAQVVASVLRSNRVNYWTGQEGRSFEKEFAIWAGSNRAIALANGTMALDLALQGLGVGAAYGGASTDEVVVTPRSFIASVSCVVNAGAVPVFADVDRDSGNLSVETMSAAITKNTRAVLPVHLGGWPCDMPAIINFAQGHGIRVVEDCAQGHGAMISGKSIGSFGDVGAWSFCQDKIMTTGGEGGMVTCDDQELWTRMWSFKDHGKSWEAVYNRSHPPGFRWVHETIGTNWRMLEMQAAIGRIQLRRMMKWREQRQKNASRIWSALRQHSLIRVPEVPKDMIHACYRAYAYVEPEFLVSGWSRDRIVAEINAQGVPCYQGSCSEIYLEKAFENSRSRPLQRLPVARELGENSLMFLVHPTLEEEHIVMTEKAIHQVLENASRR